MPVFKSKRKHKLPKPLKIIANIEKIWKSFHPRILPINYCFNWVHCLFQLREPFHRLAEDTITKTRYNSNIQAGVSQQLHKPCIEKDWQRYAKHKP